MAADRPSRSKEGGLMAAMAADDISEHGTKKLVLQSAAQMNILDLVCAQHRYIAAYMHVAACTIRGEFKICMTSFLALHV